LPSDFALVKAAFTAFSSRLATFYHPWD